MTPKRSSITRFPAVLGQNTECGGVIVVSELKGRWQGVIQKIYLDETNTTVQKLEMFNLNGSLTYAAELDRRKTLSGFSIPFRLRLFNTEQLVFALTVERCWVNIPVETAVFTLTPP